MTWRWHFLLKSGRTAKFSVSQAALSALQREIAGWYEIYRPMPDGPPTGVGRVGGLTAPSITVWQLSASGPMGRQSAGQLSTDSPIPHRLVSQRPLPHEVMGVKSARQFCRVSARSWRPLPQVAGASVVFNASL